MKTLSQLKNDKRIVTISDERNNGDGIFVYLTSEYRDFDFDPYNPTGTIHEQTVKDINKRLKGVKHI